MPEEAVRLLAELLKAVVEDESSTCPTDPPASPCAVCDAADAAQTFLNDLRPDLNTGWWLDYSYFVPGGTG